jgi:ribosomal protein L37E
MRRKKMALIKCPECGKEVSDRSDQCIHCGYPIKEEMDKLKQESQVEEVQQERELEEDNAVTESEQELEQEDEEKEELEVDTDEDIIQNTVENSPLSNKDKLSYIKHSKTFLFSGAIVICLILAGVFTIFGRSSSTELKDAAPVLFVDDSGTAFVQNGKKLIEIKGDAVSGSVSMDGKHIVVLEDDGTLYSYNGKGKNKEKIAEHVSDIAAIRNKGLIYKVETESDTTVDDILEAIVEDYWDFTTIDRVREVFEDELDGETVYDAKAMYYNVIGEFYMDGYTGQDAYRYLFNTKNPVLLGDVEFKIAAYSLNMIFDDSKSVYVWHESDKVPLNVFTYESNEQIELLGASENEKFAAWNVSSDGMVEVYVLEDNEKIKIGEFEESKYSKYGFSEIAFVNKGTEAIVWNYDSDKIFRKKAGKDPQSIAVGGTVFNSGVFCREGKITANESIKVKELYVQVKSEDESEDINFYCVQENGDREKLLSNVNSIYGIMNKKAYYLTEDNNLYSAELGEKEIKEKTKIASDVEAVNCPNNGSKIYFTKDYVETKYTLYVVETKDKNPEPEKVGSDVSYYYLSEDGETVAYIADATEFKDSYNWMGELYVKRMGKDAKKVSSDVLTILPNKEDNKIIEDELSFYKFDHVNDNGDIFGNYVIYNGKDTKTVGKNLIYYTKVYDEESEDN